MLTRRGFNYSLLAGAFSATADLSMVAADTLEVRPPRGYQLVWHDEFSIDGRPNPRNWGYEHGFVRNHELQWYQPENAFCKDGRLIITARRQTVRNPGYQPGSTNWQRRRKYAHYTSSSLTTRGKHSWKYGIFAMRGRIDVRQGLWPAWWTLGVSKPWPACGEVDIMEYYQGHINANVAWQSANGAAHWKSKFTPISIFHDPSWSSQFHLWVMQWEPSFIRLYLDGHLYNHVDLTKTLDPRYHNFNPFHQPMFMILNLAVGGAAGNPAHTRFPGYFEVDYVRIYQRR
jgi:beta-glucanase (GH16 family)